MENPIILSKFPLDCYGVSNIILMPNQWNKKEFISCEKIHYIFTFQTDEFT